MRKIPPKIIVNGRINLYKAGLKDITVSDLERTTWQAAMCRMLS